MCVVHRDLNMHFIPLSQLKRGEDTLLYAQYNTYSHSFNRHVQARMSDKIDGNETVKKEMKGERRMRRILVEILLAFHPE